MEDFIIGLEIHIHLKTNSKLFCSCPVPNENDIPNSTICPICTGQPGTKPKLPNKKAFNSVVKLGLVFNSKITKNTFLNRKHYSWADMPTGFQRTFSGSGTIPNCVGGEFCGIKIEEMHLEEDPAAWNPKSGEVNYNRSGIALCELVTKPEFKDLEKLKNWLNELILVCKHLDILNEDYGIKSDVNVSIKKSGYKRVEIKNINSIQNICDAAMCEIKRQKGLVDGGEEIKQETRRFDEETQTTQFMRSKENAMDYRFIPEVDLPNIIIDSNYISTLKKDIPKLPNELRENYKKYNFDKKSENILIENPYLTKIFDYGVSKNLNPNEVQKFLTREILRVLNYNNHTFLDLEKKNIREEIIFLIEYLGEDKINYSTAQKVLEKLYDENIEVKKYIEDNNLYQVSDTNLIENLIKEALENNKKALEDYKSGNDKALNFIIGFVMNKTNRTAKPHIIQEKLKKVLELF